MGDAVASTIKEVGEWLTEMATAAGGAAKAADGDGEIGKVVDNGNNANKGDKASVNGIANGIKAIVGVAKKAGVKWEPADAAEAGANDGNKNAGKLFATSGRGDAGDEKYAALAVSGVSGDQILNAIIADAGGEKNGAKTDAATNSIDAAIGADGDNGNNGFNNDAMKKKNDKIAAAIVLRGMAKGGKFALDGADGQKDLKNTVENAVHKTMVTAAGGAAKAANGDGEIGKVVNAGANDNKGDKASVNGIANGIKAIVGVAKKAGVKWEPAAAAEAGDDDGNKNAGKLFATSGQGNAGDEKEAALAVSGVSGDQILNAIVADAGGEKNGAATKDATNSIEAAIGADGDNGASGFNNDAMKKKNDKIAAAIVLRGMAKGGKFALNDANGRKDLKNTVENAVHKTMVTAAGGAAKAADGDGEIGKVVDAGNNANKGDKASVNGIANGIKAIVGVAKKAGVKWEPAAAAEAGDANGNKNAGKLFATNGGQGDAAAGKEAALAVSGVSGDQILNAIVADAGEDKNGAKTEDATNSIDAAIGADGDDGNNGFDAMKKKNDKIAAAIVLRGMAKGGKFALAGAGQKDLKNTVENAVHKTMATAAGGAAKAANGDGEIGKVVDAGNNANKGDKASVNGIANGIKAIVGVAKKAGVKWEPADAAEAGNDADGNKNAGKLFATNGGQGDAGDEKYAALAVSGVSGDQILNAIIADAGEDKSGAKTKDATNSIDAAIGADGDNGANGFDAMKKKNDKIAAAIVLRGMAKGGKFALNGADAGRKDLKNTVENAVHKTMATAADGAAKAANGDGEIGKVVDNGANANRGDKASVNGIANGIKAIVGVAKKAGVKWEPAAAAEAGDAADGNKNAGKLFATTGGGRGDAGDEKYAALAVSGVSGDQILNAIVADAEGEEKNGAKTKDATNSIDAAIGADDDDGNNGFNNAAMKKKNDKIAAAIVLRGMAKGGKFALDGANGQKDLKNTVENAVHKTMATAADGAAKAANGDGDEIGKVVANGANDNKGDKASVNGIANGIKAIVGVAKKAGVKWEPAAAAEAGTNDGNKNAGKLFATGGQGDAAAGKDAALAVSGVSGDQILNAIVADAEGEKNGAKTEDATNSIDAAIGADNDDGNNGFNNAAMKKKNDKIAAAIVLRGMAKGGKFALAGAGQKDLKNTVENAVHKTMATAAGGAAKAANGDGDEIGKVVANGANANRGDKASVNGIANGIKAIVGVAKKAGVKWEPADAAEAGNDADGNKNAGKLFATTGGGRGDAGDEKYAALAVSGVSGDQILNAIIADAEGEEKNGAKTEDATNSIDAAIGADGDNGASGFDAMKKKNDKIAAAIVLRGMAKGGKFALNDANGQKDLKNTVENAVHKTMATAADGAAKAANGDGDEIGKVVANGANDNKGDKASVNGIANGIKAIVGVAKKAGVKWEPAAAAEAGTNDGNKNAGKLFATGGQGDAAAGKEAALAVSGVSGDQILNAIVADAGEDKNGAKTEDATNSIDAAIGADNDDGNNGFNNAAMKKKNDKIAAAIVLRGMAKGGKFALAGAGQKDLKNTVENAVHKTMATAAGGAAKAANGDGDEIGKVVANGANANRGDKASVNGIANGIKAIVGVAKKAGVKWEPAAAAEAGNDADGNKNAGKLFATNGGQGDAAAGKEAALAVSGVSGDQILNAIIADAGGEKSGAKTDAATNSIDAAIGADNDDGASGFNNAAMKKKNDKIAAAIVLRGMAKGGKFALNDANGQKDLKNTVENAVHKTMVTAAGGAAKAADGDGEIGKVVDAGNNANRGDKASVNGIANGIKAIVGVAKKAGVKWEPAAAAEAGDANGNKNAGKLFATNGGQGDAAAGKEAALAVSGVSGDQILNAIVADAEGEDKNGAKTDAATNSIDAAIGADNDNGASGFNNDAMKKKNDKIAAAIVLRGMAKGGKFALNGADAGRKDLKNTVENAVHKTMVTAAGGAAKAANGDGDEIGKVVNAGANANKGDKASVNGIANGIKAIVGVAKKAGVKWEPAAAAEAGDADGNKNAGKLFATGGQGDAAAGKEAALAVSGVSGDQILNAIVADAGEDKSGVATANATNSIDAAIGADGDDGNNGFNNAAMKKKNDKIAAAIVLRGMAKGGKFALAGAGQKDLKNTVENAVHKTMATAAGGAAKAANGDGDEIGKVVANGANANRGDKASVNGIANGIKAIVGVAKKAGVKWEPAAAEAGDDDGNKNAGKLFATSGQGDAAAGKEAALAVSGVSGGSDIKCYCY
ncbi:variable large family protein [Borreliella garinii]|uniref:variable large family protein n=1 Tax=Borreliella garinii TaxID=29519 RepID=UPI00292E6C08|nr:variable large family protein [Borreliella garinii]WNZ73104.1 variable large family protein [Borreliella garinii]